MGASGHLGIALGLGLALMIARPALAEPVRLPEVTAKVGTTIVRWQDAARTLERTRTEQSTLEHRIAALKSLEANRPVKSAELELLLESSLAADDLMKRDLRTEAERRRTAADTIKSAIQSIDSEIRQLVPALKAGSIEHRTQAAKRLGQLKEARDEMKGELARLKAPGQKSNAWSAYDVPIGPLDGPSELKEKADLVDDTRDKLQRKRDALAKLIEDAREEQQLGQAARDFATDVTLFDEESRSGRVQRKSGALAAATQQRDNQARSNSQPQPQAQPNPNPPTEVGTLADPQASAAPPAGRSDSAFEADGVGGAVVGANNNKTTAPAPSPAPARAVVPTTVGAPISKDVNASVLLGLRIEDLAAQGVDLATLERLVGELKQLDGHLAAQAGQIRALAKQLESDEAKALRRP